MPAYAGLANRLKILVYLVALQGWKFVTDEPIPGDARPADIETATGIPGGSLRPTLRELSENHVLTERDSRYSVRGTGLGEIEGHLKGGEEDVAVRRMRSSPRRKGRKVRAATDGTKDQSDAEIDQEAEPSGAKRARKASAKTGNIASTFDGWIDAGYFDEPRTLAEVQKRFRQQAMMVPQTSLPSYFIGAVRKGRLKRDEVVVGGKTVWGYSTNNKAAR